MILYKIENLKNNNFYLVRTTNFRTSKARIKYKLNNSQFTSYYLQNEWNKFGSKNFVFTLLFEGSKEVIDLEYKELKDLATYNPKDTKSHPWSKYPVVVNLAPKTELIVDADGDTLPLKYCVNCALHKLEDSFISTSYYCRPCREHLEDEDKEIDEILTTIVI